MMLEHHLGLVNVTATMSKRIIDVSIIIDVLTGPCSTMYVRPCGAMCVVNTDFDLASQVWHTRITNTHDITTDVYWCERGRCSIYSCKRLSNTEQQNICVMLRYSQRVHFGQLITRTAKRDPNQQSWKHAYENHWANTRIAFCLRISTAHN